MAKPREGRKRCKHELLSPLTGLLNFTYHLIPRLAPWAINLSPLTGLSVTRHYVELTLINCP